MTRRQVRWVDQWAIGTLGAPPEILMENAGRSAAQAAADMVQIALRRAWPCWPARATTPAMAFAWRAHLRIRHIAVDVYLLGERAKFTGEALMNLELCERLLGPVREVRGKPAAELTELWRPYDLLVDALGGTGITGALRGDLAAGVEGANATGVPILAIDIPTGLDCDTGEAAGPVIRACEPSPSSPARSASTPPARPNTPAR